MTLGERQSGKHHKDRNKKERNRISSNTGRKKPRAERKEIRDKVQDTGWSKAVKEMGDKRRH